MVHFLDPHVIHVPPILTKTYKGAVETTTWIYKKEKGKEGFWVPVHCVSLLVKERD